MKYCIFHKIGQCLAESSSTIAKDAQNINGLSDVTDGSSVKKDSPTKSEKIVAKDESSTIDSSSAMVPATPKTPVAKLEQSTYDVNISYDQSELVYFSVNKQGTNSASTLSTTSAEEKVEQEIKGTADLCTFIIDHFEKVRLSITIYFVLRN